MKYESPITYHSRDMANVKNFADRRTGENFMPPIFRYGGIKTHNMWSFIQNLLTGQEELILNSFSGTTALIIFFDKLNGE